MKKYLAGGFHALAILLIIIGVSLLTIGSPSGMGLRLLAQPDFVASSDFENLVSENINDIFEYTDLRELFESSGKLDLNKVIAQAESGGQTVSYTLDYLIRYARAQGYYLNEKNEVVSGSSDTSRERTPGDKDRINVTYRAYMPDFKPQSPSDGIMTLSDLALETLNYLAKYYALRSNYFDSPSNLLFCVYYYSSGRSTVYTNAPDDTPEEMMSRGKYLYTSSDTIEVKTNLPKVPSNVIPMLQAKNPYSGGSYYFVFGIDTEFPAADSLRAAYLNYSSQRATAIAALAFLGLGGLMALGSLGVLAAQAGHRPDSRKIVCTPFDNVPLELLFPAYAFWVFAAGELGWRLTDSASLLLGSFRYQDYWSSTISLCLDYAALFLIGGSLVRRYKAGRLWETTLLRQLKAVFSRCLKGAKFTSSRAFSRLCFLLPNLAGVLLIAVLLARFFAARSLLSFLTAAALLLILAAIDFYAYNISTGLSAAVSEQVKAERLKADLITNVSHDIKTPLTSIISYVDLLKREQIDNPRVQNYIEVLDQKSNRLKVLTEDLVEASKASSGNINIEFSKLNLAEMAQQAVGEFEDKYRVRRLETVCTVPDHPVMILADGRRLWRVLENLLNNAGKYAMEGSRVYIEVREDEDSAVFTIKNVSEAPLNISPDELTERFVRGDVSRTTEGSGLGLSIAKSLTTLMKGRLVISIDGDLYKASVVFAPAA